MNEAFVKRFFRNDEDPLEQHFGMDLPENAGMFRIVGIVRDAKFAGFALDKPARPMFYLPLAQTAKYDHELLQKIDRMSHFVTGMMLVTDLPTGQIEALLARKLSDIDPNLTRVSAQVDAYNTYAGFEAMTNDVVEWNLLSALAFGPVGLAIAMGASWA